MNGISKKYIVITSIASPTKAVKQFAELEGYKLIVVGDKRTPDNWELENCKYISLAEQNKDEFILSKKLPFNHYSRKMIGYLNAIKSGANVIIDTDDDNIPKPDWGFPDFDSNYETIIGELGFVNIYKLFSNQKIWARGFPINKINSANDIILSREDENKSTSVGVWQGLADGDPDVDAIYRLVSNEPCIFKERNPVVLSKGTLSPFNSQNTAFRKELFPLLYLPAFVTFRFTDILRGLAAQPIMWLYDYKLGFINATVVQERNEHNYLKDFESEIPVYLLTEKIIEIVSNKINSQLSVGENLFIAYEELYRNSVVKKEELELLKTWLTELGL